jgi:guanylate kinase
MKIEREGIFFCLSSPAGAGKTTISEALLRETQQAIQRVVTWTARERRPQETEGQSYHFISKKQFEEDIKSQLFFEWEEVHGNFYGIKHSDLTGGTDKLLIVDIRGALSLKKAFPSRTVLVIVLPPRPEDLKFRLLSRGTEEDSQVERRLQTAKKEYEMFLSQREKIDYLIVNDNLADAISYFHAIIEAEKLRFSRLSSKTVAELSHFDLKSESGDN